MIKQEHLKKYILKVENLTTKEVIGEYFYDTLSRRYKKVTKTDTTNYIYSNENILSEKYLDNSQKYYINGIGTDNLVGFVLGKPDFSELETSEYDFCTTKVLIYKEDFIKFGYQNIVDRCLVLQEKSKNLLFKKYYFEKDNLGSIIGISNDNGEIISSYEYDSFGNILNNSNLNFKNSRLFTSREFDEETGFYYYRARYYDARTGKFISRDPIDIADDVNLYVYVGNNPVNFVDPSGEKAKEVGNVVISLHPSYDVGGVIGGTALYVKGVYEGNEEYKKYGLEGALVSLSGLIKPSKKIKKVGEVVKVVEKASGMLGSKGPKIESKTINNFKGGGRIDIENPNPGNRPGQIHYQQKGDPNKYYYNEKTGTFNIGRSDGPIAPKNIQNLLKDKEFKKSIDKGMYFLNGGN